MKADVVCSGGGANFVMVAGAMDCLVSAGIEPTGLFGTSAPTLTFAPMACGHHPRDLKEVAKELTPGKVIRKNWRPFTPGIFHLDKVVDVLKPLTPPTFKDCDIPLTVVTTDSDTGETVYFSTEDTPGACVARAVQASCSVPWLFRHVTIGGRRLVDGGVTNNFAIDRPKSSSVVGIRIQGAKSEMKPWRWWASFSANMFGAMMQAIEREHVEDALWAQVVTIKSPIGGMDFHKLDSAMIERLYAIGYQAVEKKLHNGWLR
jgi:NTE family protein